MDEQTEVLERLRGLMSTQRFAVLSTGFIVAAMFLWPWIDKLLRRITKIEDISVYIGIVATLLLIGLTVWEAVVTH